MKVAWLLVVVLVAGLLGPSGVAPSNLAFDKDPGKAPEDCPGPKPRPKRVHNDYGRVVGAKPVWAGIYARKDGTAYREDDAPRRRRGWRIKVLWVMHRDNELPVRIRGRNVTTGEPMWFNIWGKTKKVERMNPDKPKVPAGENDWKEYPSYVFFPRAGCYRLRARWEGGSWRIGFGFGS